MPSPPPPAAMCGRPMPPPALPRTSSTCEGSRRAFGRKRISAPTLEGAAWLRAALRPSRLRLVLLLRRRLRRRHRGGAGAELLRPERRAGLALEALAGEVADADLGVGGREDVLAVAVGVEPCVHRLARRAVVARAPGDVLADLVARRAGQVRREDDGARLSARRMRELGARDVGLELRLPGRVERR